MAWINGETDVKLTTELLKMLPPFDPSWTEEERALWREVRRETTAAALDALANYQREKKELEDEKRLEGLIVEELRRAGFFKSMVAFVKQCMEETREAPE